MAGAGLGVAQTKIRKGTRSKNKFAYQRGFGVPEISGSMRFQLRVGLCDYLRIVAGMVSETLRWVFLPSGVRVYERDQS